MGSLTGSLGGRRLRPRGVRVHPHALALCGLAAFAVALFSPSSAASQSAGLPEGHPLLPLAFLVGTWTGELDGTIGPSTARREYRLFLDDHFLQLRHDRDPGEAAPDADAYEEWVVFGFDPVREAVVVREFLAEGLVNTYECEVDPGPARLVCASEAAEDGAGPNATFRYDVEGPDRFTETFELAGPDGRVRVRIVGSWTRVGG